MTSSMGRISLWIERFEKFLQSSILYLHRVKERKSIVCPTGPVFTPFSLKVAWSGKSLIIQLAL